MKRAHLHLVEDNTPREAIRVTPTKAAEIDFCALAARARYWFALIGLNLGAPFRFAAALGRMPAAASSLRSTVCSLEQSESR